jgi:hypothetical protein
MIFQANLVSAIRIMKVAKRSPMRINDVTGKSAINIMKVGPSLLSVLLIRNTEFRMRLAFCYPHSYRRGKFERIQFSA